MPQECEKLDKCPFFNDRMSTRPHLAKMMKVKYCKGDKTLCARYQVAWKGVAVPADLFPNQVEKIPAILAA